MEEVVIVVVEEIIKEKVEIEEDVVDIEGEEEAMLSQMKTEEEEATVVEEAEVDLICMMTKILLETIQ